MIAVLLSDPGLMLMSSAMLAANAFVLVACSGARLRVLFLIALLLVQSAYIALAAVNAPAHYQTPVLAWSCLVMTVQWLLIAFAFIPAPGPAAAATESTT